MTVEVGPAIVGALIGNALAFGAVLLKLGAVGQRLELLWEWYLNVHNNNPQPGGRRLGDPRLRSLSHPPFDDHDEGR